jgi:hypothetical protein
MKLRDMFGRWLPGPRPTQQPAARRHGLRLHLEQLEDRTVPANFTAATVSDLIADINAANLTAEADTITLVAGKTFTLPTVNNTTDGANGLPVIATNENLTIIGNGDIIERSTAKGTPAFRLFDVAKGGSLTLENLMLQGGLAYGSGYAASSGGAVYNLGKLSLHGVTVQNNTALGRDGSLVYIPWSGTYVNTAGSNAVGGGLYSNGTLTMEGCTIRNNAALGGRGADYVYSSTGHTYFATDGGRAYGGGVYIDGGTGMITGSAVTSNTAKGGAGGKGGGSGNTAKAGQGVGGGLYIAAGASVGLNAFTVSQLTKNQASTSNNDIFGSYDVIT